MPTHARKWLAGVLPAMLWLTSAAAYGSVSGGAKAEPPGKPAWRWTAEERLARRFDPEAMKARVAEQRAEQSASHMLFPKIDDGLFAEGEEGTSGITDTLDGRKHPELFFPDELFASLLNDGFPPAGEPRSETRRPIEERAAALGFGRDDWGARLGVARLDFGAGMTAAEAADFSARVDL